MTKPQSQPVDIAFLESKEFTHYNPWAGAEITARAQSGNIHRISNDVFSFTEYNYLPSGEGDVLDGHYTFFVNIKTFDYLVYKSSDYGSLTYVIPCEFGGAFLTKESLPEISRKRVEAIIASKLLGAYFYDRNAVFSKGASLFSDGTPSELNGTNVHGEKIYWFKDGMKRSLICDNRGYIWSGIKPETYNQSELAALKILAGFEQPNIPEFEPEFVKAFTKKFHSKKGTQQAHSIEVNGVQYNVVREVLSYSKGTALVKDGEVIAKEHLDGSLTKFVRQIPTILKNIAH